MNRHRFRRNRHRASSDRFALIIIAMLIVFGGGLSLLAMCGVGK